MVLWSGADGDLARDLKGREHLEQGGQVLGPGPAHSSSPLQGTLSPIPAPHRPPVLQLPHFWGSPLGPCCPSVSHHQMVCPVMSFYWQLQRANESRAPLLPCPLGLKQFLELGYSGRGGALGQGAGFCQEAGLCRVRGGASCQGVGLGLLWVELCLIRDGANSQEAGLYSMRGRTFCWVAGLCLRGGANCEEVGLCSPWGRTCCEKAGLCLFMGGVSCDGGLRGGASIEGAGLSPLRGGAPC